MRGVAVVVLVVVVGAGALALAQPRSFAGARSVVVTRGTAARVSPDDDAEQRGTIRGDARLPVLEVRETAGRCRLWVRVGAEAWVCGSDLVPSDQAPAGRSYPRLRPGAILP